MRDESLLLQALCHRSWCAENPGWESNERLVDGRHAQVAREGVQLVVRRCHEAGQLAFSFTST